MRGSEILSVDPTSPDQHTIRKAAALIKNGGLVVFPTSSFYGLGTSAFNAEAVDKVFRVKKRDSKKPILVLIASLAQLDPLVEAIPRLSRRLMEAFWPGSLTLVFHASALIPSSLTGYTGKVGIRLANHVAALSLVRAVGHPITGTSANVSGQGGCHAVSQLDVHIRDEVDLILDAGTLPGAKESTVVDVTADPPGIIREGAIQAEEIRAVLEG